MSNNCTLTTSIVSVNQIQNNLQNLLPSNYFSIYLKQQNDDNLRNLIVSILPFTLPWLILAILFVIGWITCCCQLCLGKCINCCKNRKYTQSQISVYGCITLFTIVAACMLTIFVMIVAYDYKNSVGNTLCRLNITSLSLLQGQSNLTDVSQNFIGFEGGTKTVQALNNVLNDNKNYVKAVLDSFNNINDNASTPLTNLCSFNPTVSLPNGGTSLSIINQYCTNLTTQFSTFKSVPTAIQNLKTLFNSNDINDNTVLSSYTNLFVSGSPINTKLLSFASDTRTASQNISDILRYTDLGLILLFSLLFGIYLVFIILTIIGLLCPFTMDCYKCSALIYVNWIIISLATTIMLLLTMTLGLSFVAAGNSSLTIGQLVQSPSQFSSGLTDIFGSQISNCITNPSTNFFNLSNVNLNTTQSSVLNSLNSVATQYAITTNFQYFSTSSGLFIAQTDEYLYDLSTLPNSGASQFLQQINSPSGCQSNVTFVFNPAFCNGVALTTQTANISGNQAYCTLINADNQTVANSIIQPIQSPYPNNTQFDAIINRQIVLYPCLNASQIFTLKNYQTTTAPALALIQNYLITFFTDLTQNYRNTYNIFTFQASSRLGQIVEYMNRIGNGISCNYFISKASLSQSNLTQLSAQSFLFWIIMIILSSLSILISCLSFMLTSRMAIFEKRHGKVSLQYPPQFEQDTKQINLEMEKLQS